MAKNILITSNKIQINVSDLESLPCLPQVIYMKAIFSLIIIIFHLQASVIFKVQTEAHQYRAGKHYIHRIKLPV